MEEHEIEQEDQKDQEEMQRQRAVAREQDKDTQCGGRICRKGGKLSMEYKEKEEEEGKK